MLRKLFTALLSLSAIITGTWPCAVAADSSRAPQAKETGPAIAATRAHLLKMLGAYEVVFIKRFTYTSNPYYTEFLNSQWKPGGICMLLLKDGSVQQLAGELKGGAFGRMDLFFDARTIAFDWKRSNDEGYRIYEFGPHGNGLRQILRAPDKEAELVNRYQCEYHNGTDDMHPCYLPDGRVTFVSTRFLTSAICHGGYAFTTCVLDRMDADGGNLVHPIGYLEQHLRLETEIPVGIHQSAIGISPLPEDQQ